MSLTCRGKSTHIPQSRKHAPSCWWKTIESLLPPFLPVLILSRARARVPARAQGHFASLSAVHLPNCMSLLGKYVVYMTMNVLYVFDFKMAGCDEGT